EEEEEEEGHYQKHRRNQNCRNPKRAAPRFALGPHRWTVTLQILYARDLVELGYNVLVQDTDVVWLRDVRKYFSDSYNDVEMSCDGRLDDVGPGNSGFIFVRSSCKTQVFMNTLVEYIGLVITGRSDQRHWNMFLREYDFRQLNFFLLPPDQFVSGYQWGDHSPTHKISNTTFWVAHASWTTFHFEKINKFKTLLLWFFNHTLCPAHFDPLLLPDLRQERLKDPSILLEPQKILTPSLRTWKWPDDAIKERPFWTLQQQPVNFLNFFFFTHTPPPFSKLRTFFFQKKKRFFLLKKKITHLATTLRN
ncbi:hypothetical protein RFI_17913, partial [Reticulomyxa filosa]